MLNVIAVIQGEREIRIKLMRKILYILLLLIINPELFGQLKEEGLSGKVSFISSQNVYVKFKSTNGISPGDTLFINSGKILIPVLIVKNLSSTSCVCFSISSDSIALSQDVQARNKVKTAAPGGLVAETVVQKVPPPVTSPDTSKYITITKELKQRINGSVSAYAYSDFSNTPAKNSTQLRYNYSLDARNIGNSKFSIENYITFRHKIGDWQSVKNNLNNALKIYTFAVIYDADKTTRVTLGRTINYKISSIGAMDGLQVEKTLKNFSLGAVAGFRPDYTDYSFNSNLFQYGGYLAFNTKSVESFSETSLAFMQQTNNMKTDRRFVYFQHSNSLIKNIYFFSSFEVDLFKVKNDIPQNTFDLTAMYLSLRLRMTRNFTLTGSYDTRKNVLFYETYKSLIDSVLQNELRQSFRVNANYRIANNLTLGIESGYRFLKSDPHPSRNINGYLAYSQIPALKISMTVNATYLESNYMNGKIFGGDISKDLFMGKLQASLGYRYVNYTVPENKQSILQNIGEVNFYWQFSRKLSFSAYYEGTFEKQDKYNRVYLQIRKRF